ncbi:LOW QUALITY PROTEIN: uncharacterized protein ACIGJ3_014075 [Trichechus inunguis]
MSNHSVLRDFMLLGFSHLHEFQVVLFAFILLIYMLTVLGNLAIVTLTCLDSRLHSPMYFFLCNFSLMEVLVISMVVPRMLADLLSTSKTMSLAECLTQYFFYFSLGSTNFLILTVVAFNLYVAICHPLHYPTIMSRPVCVKLVVACWVVGFLSIISPTLKTQLWFCGPNVIDHYFCDSAPLLQLSCSDTRHIERMDLFLSLLFVLATVLLILAPYALIVAAVLRIPSAMGRQKAFSTCTSRLTMVVLGYGSTIFIYVRPGKGHATHLNRVVTLMMAVVTPFPNLFIFTFQNEKVKEVIGDTAKRVLAVGAGPRAGRVPSEGGALEAGGQGLQSLKALGNGLDCVIAEGQKIEHEKGPLQQSLKLTKRGEAHEDELRFHKEQNKDKMLGNLSSATKFCLLGFRGPPKLHYILFTIFFFFYSVIVMGNSVIITIVCVNKRLHSPMYFFLGHLSVLKTLTTTTVVPMMLWGLLLPGMQTISLTTCVTQLILYLTLGTTEFALLGAMAVDRYVPLRYNIIMNSPTCTWVVIASWVFAFLSEIWPVYIMFQFTFCKSNGLDHFFCDRGLLKLSCDDTLFTEFILFLMAVFIIVGSLIPTIVSYTYIISTILKILTASGRRKAFSTCASHFTFVVIGCDTCFFLYVKPKQTQAAEYNKVVSLLISVVTPFLSPFIFTLWNDKVKEALGDGVKCCCQFLKD